MEEVLDIVGIGGIGNYYGGLRVGKRGDKYVWAIENYAGLDWEEISPELYHALIIHNDK